MSKMKKTRKPGGGRKKLKPEYDAGKNLKDQMDAAVALYEEDCSLQSIADVLNLNPIKVRKLLITAGVYESEVAEEVQDTFERYRKTQDYKTSILSTATVLGLSKASVTSYLPYKKGVYFQSTEKEKISVGAERQRRYRAVRKLRTEPTEEHLWEVVLLYSLCGAVPFYQRGPAATCESNFQEKIPCRAFQGIGCLCRIREIFPGRKRWKAAIAEIFEKTEGRTDQRNCGEEKGIRSLKGRIPASGNCIG